MNNNNNNNCAYNIFEVNISDITHLLCCVYEEVGMHWQRRGNHKIERKIIFSLCKFFMCILGGYVYVYVVCLCLWKRVRRNLPEFFLFHFDVDIWYIGYIDNIMLGLVCVCVYFYIIMLPLYSLLVGIINYKRTKTKFKVKELRCFFRSA